ncbi:MAG: hypothetical protein H6502_00645 [Candidatus Woesearchaeota archaeon]|nr:MAG: hypothetical protein H6502_00645 [Candidatus Woesearchaeota archaeon]
MKTAVTPPNPPSRKEGTVIDADDYPADHEAEQALQDLTQHLNTTPTQGEASDAVLAEILEILSSHDPMGKYSSLRPHRKGGTRKTYLANWGKAGLPVIFKADIAANELVSSHAKRHVLERGCTTENELDIISEIEHPEQHYLIGLRDFFVSEKLLALGSPSGTITVENFFDGKTLEELVQEDGVLSKKEFEELFSQQLEAERYLINEVGVYHRDNHKRNILVKKTNKGIESRLTDYGNAIKKDRVQAKVLPTGGSTYILDPTLGETQAHDETSELFAIGKNMIYALTGEEVRDNSLAAIKEALHKIKGGAKKYVPFIDRLVSHDREERFENIDQAIAAFAELKKPGFFKHLVTNYAKQTMFAAGVLSTVTLSTVGAFLYQSADFAAQLAEESKRGVEMKVLDRTADISNDLFDATVRLYSWDDCDHRWPEVEALRVAPGESLSGDIEAICEKIPIFDGNYGIYRFLSLPHFYGRAYIEGIDKEDHVGVWPDRSESTVALDMHEGGAYGDGINYTIPEDIAPGTHYFVVELFSPGNEKPQYGNDWSEHLKLPEKGTLMFRTHIPLIVGEETQGVDLKFLALNRMPDQLSLGEVYEAPSKGYTFEPKNLTMEVSLPDEGHEFTLRNKSNRHPLHTYLNMPNTNNTEVQPLQIVVRDSTGTINSCMYLPIKRQEETYNEGRYQLWEFGIPGLEWKDKVKMLRDDVFARDWIATHPEVQQTFEVYQAAQERFIADVPKLTDRIEFNQSQLDSLWNNAAQFGFH